MDASFSQQNKQQLGQFIDENESNYNRNYATNGMGNRYSSRSSLSQIATGSSSNNYHSIIKRDFQ
jgi:hypothetical protein